MDTKWKKSKIILSSMAFFLGMTLLISSLAPVAGLMLTKGSFSRRWEGDYQESENFRWRISRQLEDLLGAATGGKSYRYYGTGTMDWGYDYAMDEWIVDNYAVQEETVLQVEEALEDLEDLELYMGNSKNSQELESVLSRLEEIQVKLDRLNDRLDQEERNRQTESISKTEQEAIDAYMADKAQNKNLRYAVVYQGKLLYTNIDALEGATGKPWDGTDFYEQLSGEEYNFSLWFNRNGDGKVEITKDGNSQDVYGDGVYTENSLWYVPGYTNFNVDTATKDAVVFLAAAKEPKVYVAGNYSGYGTTEYGNELYQMYQYALQRKKELRVNCILLLIGILLLGLSLIWRKEKRLGKEAVAGFLGKLWLELKLLLVFVLLLLVVALLGRSEWWMEYAQYVFYEPDYWWIQSIDIAYCVQELLRHGVLLAVCFWIIYLTVLDIRVNRGKQKKPIIGSLQTGDLRYPLQKRLVRRYSLMFITEILALLLCGLSIGVIFVNVTGYCFKYPWNRIPWNGMFVTAIVVVGILLLTCIIVSAVYWQKNRRLAEDIGALTDQIHEVKEGNLIQPLQLPESADLRQAAENLNEIQHGMEVALREQVQSERMKVDLVTNVSHDIKTPLTSIVSYVDLLKQEENLPPHVEEFIQILDEKSARLKTMVQDVFDISKATSGQLPVTMEELDLGKLLRQTLADMDIQIAESGLIMKVTIPEAPVMIRADGQRLYRVFQNLIQNALKYSLQGSRIFLSLTEEKETSIVRIRNTSGTELDGTVDFTERFLRGDESRTDGGSGLGLSIAKSFTEACGGSFRVEVDGDLFTAIVSIPKQ